MRSIISHILVPAIALFAFVMPISIHAQTQLIEEGQCDSLNPDPATGKKTLFCCIDEVNLYVKEGLKDEMQDFIDDVKSTLTMDPFESLTFYQSPYQSLLHDAYDLKTPCGEAIACSLCVAGYTEEATTKSVCGDGNINGLEQCDDGTENSNTTPNACRSDCKRSRCGDDTEDAGEQCDDGNRDNGDGCSNTCSIEPNVLPFVTTKAVCGNDIEEEGEECDDGNIKNNDGCSSVCTNEIITPTFPPADGDENGNQGPGEDGKTDATSRLFSPNDPTTWVLKSVFNPYDQSTWLTQLSFDSQDFTTWYGVGTFNAQRPSVWYAAGLLIPGDLTSWYAVELFDSNNPSSSEFLKAFDVNNPDTWNVFTQDTEDTSVQLATNDLNSAFFNPSQGVQTSNQPGYCGDGFINPGEECDDRNQRDFDGCSSVCRLEYGECGDGILQVSLGEDCEPSLFVQSDGRRCSNRCIMVGKLCGNGELNSGEQCDLGSLNSENPDATCRTDCTRRRCGDNIIDFDNREQCDDGNTRPGDGCTATCTLEKSATERTSLITQFRASASYPLQYLSGGKITDTGPAAILFITAGAAGGVAWVRRKKK